MNDEMNKGATVEVECGRCVKGTYYYTGGSGPCFTCGGTGKLRMSAAKHARLVAGAARMAAAIDADRAEEDRVRVLEGDALAAVRSGGLGGARAWYRAHPSDRGAAGAMIVALREVGEDLRHEGEAARSEAYYDAANKIVRAINK